MAERKLKKCQMQADEAGKQCEHEKAMAKLRLLGLELGIYQHVYQP